VIPLLEIRIKHGRLVVYCGSVLPMGPQFLYKLFAFSSVIPLTLILKVDQQENYIRLSFKDIAKAMFSIYFIQLVDSSFFKLTYLFFIFLPKPSKKALDTSKTLKIMHTTCSFDWGGTQTQIMNLCLSHSHNMLHEPLEIFPEMNNMWRTEIQRSYNEYLSDTFFIGNIISLVCCLPQTFGFRAIQAYKLYRDIKREKPDVVVGWGHEMCIYTYIAAVFAKVPHIIFNIRTVNPTFYQNPSEPVFRSLHKKMFSYLSMTILNSSFLKEDHAKWLGVNKDKIEVCHNGIEIGPNYQAKVDIRSKLNLPEDSIVVLCVGRFSGEKGQQILVQSAEIMQRYRGGYENVHFIFCGDGVTKEQIENYCKQHQIKNLHFVGSVKNVNDYLKSADIFVMPSDFEGQPNAMMEAMAMGLPCISTDQSGAIDMADDGVEAFFVPPRNSEALADKLEILVNSPEIRQDMGLKAKERSAGFGISAMIDKFDSIILKAVAEG
jgi:glycosyltransferase involved in cell wall biosynthesis